jgi:hypothetical protein
VITVFDQQLPHEAKALITIRAIRMSVAMTTLSEVKTAFEDVPNADISEADVHGRVAEVTVSGNLAGQMYQTLRTADFEWESKRLGKRMVAHIEVEEEDEGWQII